MHPMMGHCGNQLIPSTMAMGCSQLVLHPVGLHVQTWFEIQGLVELHKTIFIIGKSHDMKDKNAWQATEGDGFGGEGGGGGGGGTVALYSFTCSEKGQCIFNGMYLCMWGGTQYVGCGIHTYTM